MAADIFWILIGIVLVVKGADWLTGGAVAAAERLHVPQTVIGLTIVAMGTSMPEFCVSLVSAIKGTPDLAVGNVVGSNIFNSLLIVGCAAVVAPMTILRQTVRKDIPFALMAGVILLMMCLDGRIDRGDAAMMCLLFGVFMYITLHGAVNAEEKSPSEPKPLWKTAGLIVLGLAGLVFGSNQFVDGACNVARGLGVSDAVIGLTIVAGGTSLPELATSIVAARRGNSGIAIGNVLGSNVFNILFILGVTGLIAPMDIKGVTAVDLGVMVAAMVLLWLFSRTKYTIARWEGVVLVAAYMAYMAWLVAGVE